MLHEALNALNFSNLSLDTSNYEEMKKQSLEIYNFCLRLFDSPPKELQAGKKGSDNILYGEVHLNPGGSVYVPVLGTKVKIGRLYPHPQGKEAENENTLDLNVMFIHHETQTDKKDDQERIELRLGKGFDEEKNNLKVTDFYLGLKPDGSAWVYPAVHGIESMDPMEEMHKSQSFFFLVLSSIKS